MKGKGKECMELWLHSTLCLHYHTSALVAFEFIWKLQECVHCCCATKWSSLCQVLKEEAVRWCEILKIYVVFCFFTVGCRAREHVTMALIKC